ncbi:MAG TPA: hypothetical protein VEK06_01340, partial [Myxococcota bacterium]|nr:hypothetical protein [Myxococcota bacterium]
MINKKLWAFAFLYLLATPSISSVSSELKKLCKKRAWDQVETLVATANLDEINKKARNICTKESFCDGNAIFNVFFSMNDVVLPAMSEACARDLINSGSKE